MLSLSVSSWEADRFHVSLSKMLSLFFACLLLLIWGLFRWNTFMAVLANTVNHVSSHDESMTHQQLTTNCATEQQNEYFRINGNGVTQLSASIPVSESIQQDHLHCAEHSRTEAVTISAQCCSGTLQNLSTTILACSWGVLCCVALHCSACPCVSCAVQDMLCTMHWKVCDHPPYILDLLLCYFHVFSSHKDLLKGCRFGLGEDVDAMVMQCSSSSEGSSCEQSPAAVVAVGYLPHCLWGIFLMSSTSCPRAVPDQISFEQTS
jgi:hypothetical protein